MRETPVKQGKVFFISFHFLFRIERFQQVMAVFRDSASGEGEGVNIPSGLIDRLPRPSKGTPRLKVALAPFRAA